MPLLPMSALVSLLACPACGSPLCGSVEALGCTSNDCRRVYPAFGSNPTPILVDSDASIVDVSALLKAGAVSQISREAGGWLSRLITRITVHRNRAAERFVQRLAIDLIAETKDRRPRLLIVGGGAVGNGAESLYADPNLDLLAFDIYGSEQCQFIADAHQIPLPDRTVDGVLIQAVLEHVLNPQHVVDEIHRVLRPGGLVYADTPFMQQVHEGPYDFTRFTESGHRYLFRRFEVRSSGVTGGLGTQLHWSLLYFGRGIHRRVGQIFLIGFSWLHLLDGLLDPKAAVDGASGVFFYGHSSTRSISPQDIVEYYSGAQA
jgi:SAM-dependent methyltransferase